MGTLLGPIWATSAAVFQVLALSAIGYFLAKFRDLDRNSLKVISRLLTDVFLPAFIFYHTVKGLSSAGSLKNLWFFPILGFVVFLFSCCFALVVATVLKLERKKLFTALVSFQNCGYMPLIMVSILFSGVEQERLYSWIFLFILSFNFLVWSVGVFLVASNTKITPKEILLKIFNLPFIATILSVIVVVFNIARFLPPIFMNFLEILSKPVLPLSMLIMGGILGLNCMSCNLDRRTLFWAVITKLVLLPLSALILLKYLPFDNMVKWFVIVELSVPSAVSLAVISEAYGGDTPFISQVLFYTHLFSLFTLPIFVTLGG